MICIFYLPGDDSEVLLEMEIDGEFVVECLLWPGIFYRTVIDSLF